MIKILSASQTKELDAYTIQHEPITSIDLMERACRAFVNWFIERYDASHKIGIFCGTGNNGGDGLGIARLLNEWNYPVKVWIVRGGVKESEDFKINLHRLEGKVSISDLTSPVSMDHFSDRAILIDAIFGSGLSRGVEGIYEEVIAAMNQVKAVRIAIDIPSGLFADQHSKGEIARAHYTVSFQLPKLSFLLPENNIYIGEWHLVDIELSKKGVSEIHSDYYLITLKSIKKLVKPRGKFDHKGKFGHALIIAGSEGKMGACVLASTGALRSGVGLLTVHVPKIGYSIIQTTIPEAMALIDKSESHFSEFVSVENFSAVGVGPGLGKHPESVSALKKLLEEYRKPMVIDADALNILSENPDMIELIPSGSILTPHPKEFERLAGAWLNDFDRLVKLQRFSKKVNSVVILKGAFSTIAFPDGKAYFNPTGNPGMAKGGSGDALTGILTGLLAQGYSVEHSTLLGIYVHGLAGDLAAREKGEIGLIASDLLDFLPLAFKKIG